MKLVNTYPSNQEFLDFGSVGTYVQYDLMPAQRPEGFDYVVPQIVASNGAWGSAVVTVKISQDGSNFYAIPSASVTFTTSGIKDVVTVTAVRHLRLEVTTAGSSGITGIPTVYAVTRRV